MEKRTAHYQLSTVRMLISEGRIQVTYAAIEGAKVLGLNYDSVLTVVANLTVRDFYKSMTTHADHRVWQDVYRPTILAGSVYLKLTIRDDVIVVSFKEL